MWLFMCSFSVVPSAEWLDLFMWQLRAPRRRVVGRPHCASAHQAPACIVLANVPLAKATHMTKSRVCVGGDYRMAGTLRRIVHWDH